MIEKSENSQEKLEYLQDLYGYSEKTQKTNLQENNANFYTYLNQKRIQQMNLCN